MRSVAGESNRQGRTVANNVTRQESVGQKGREFKNSSNKSLSQYSLQLMIDSSPRMIMQRKLINSIMRNTLQAKGGLPERIPSTQSKISPVSTKSEKSLVIQPMAVNLDTGDKTINKAAIIENQRQGGKGIVTADQIDKTPLAFLEPGETLTILAHGEPAFGSQEPKVAGKTALELFNLLVRMGLTNEFTGIINLSNCTSAWDRKSTGSFASKFYKIIGSKGFDNTVMGFESFAETVDVDTELEVDYAQREMFLAHRIAERYLAALFNLGSKDSGETIAKVHDGMKTGAKEAMIESADLEKATGDESRIWANFYKQLAEEIMRYLADAGNSYNESAILTFQTNVQKLKIQTGFGTEINKVDALWTIML